MGSKISQAVFRDDRRRPVPAQRHQQLQSLAAGFLAFSGLVAFFLYGFLARAYWIDARFPALLLAAVWVWRPPLRPGPLLVLSGLLLPLFIILSSISSLPLNLIKAILLVTVVLAASDSQRGMMPSQTAGGALLWTQIQLLGLGATIAGSLGSDTQSHPLLEVSFAVVGLMGAYLAAFGRRAMLPVRGSQVPVRKRGLRLSLSSVILVTAMWHQGQSHLDGWESVAGVILVLGVMLLGSQCQWGPLWPPAYGLIAVAAALSWAAQNEPWLEPCLKLMRLIGIGLLAAETLAPVGQSGLRGQELPGLLPLALAALWIGLFPTWPELIPEPLLASAVMLVHGLLLLVKDPDEAVLL